MNQPRQTATFNVKSAQLMLLAVVLDSADAHVLQARLSEYLADDPQTFAGQGAVLDLRHLHGHSACATDEGSQDDNSNPAPPTIDFAALIAVLQRHGITAVAVRGGTPEQMQAGAAAGLLITPDAPHPRERAARAEKPTPAPVPEPPNPIVQEVIREVVSEVPVPTVLPTVVIDKDLRSGQQIYARDAHLVVLGAVNPGAEVIADGDVHVYAPLRGRAVAGAQGNTAARIFSTCMQPQLLSIAGNYRTFEEGLGAHISAQPAQAWLDEQEKLHLAALR